MESRLVVAPETEELNELAHQYFLIEEYVQAEHVYELVRKHYKTHCPETYLTATLGAAHVTRHAGRLEESSRRFDEALRTFRETGQEGSRRHISATYELGVNYIHSDRIDEAMPLLEKGYSMARKDIAQPEAFWSLNGLVMACDKIGLKSKATSLCLEAYDAFKGSLEPDHDNLYHLVLLIVSRLNERSVEGAIQFHRDFLELAQSGLRIGDPRLLEIQASFAYWLAKVGRTDEAATRYEECYYLRAQTLGELHPLTIATLKEWSGVYNNRQQEDRVASFIRSTFAKAQMDQTEIDHDTIEILEKALQAIDEDSERE